MQFNLALPSSARLPLIHRRPSVSRCSAQLGLIKKRNDRNLAARCIAGGRNDNLSDKACAKGLSGGLSDWSAVNTSSTTSQSALSALPHSQAARDSEAHHHDQAPLRSFTSFDDDEMAGVAMAATGCERLFGGASRKLKYKTIMLKVSGEALQVGPRCRG